MGFLLKIVLFGNQRFLSAWHLFARYQDYLPFSIPRQSCNPYNDCMDKPKPLEAVSSAVYYVTSDRQLNKPA